jgi:GntR family transcriptional regulator / MocR family aminotransferase
MAQKANIPFSIDRTSRIPMFEQICSAIRQAIIDGDLVEGTKLAPSRSFAADLGVSRSTIVTVYDQLCAEGYITSVPRSGMLVCAISETQFKPRQEIQNRFEDEVQTLPQPLLGGQPDMELFPHRQWAKAVAKVCRTNPQAMLLGGGRFGNFELRKAIASHVLDWRGIEASPHQIIITAGSTDALGICIRTLAKAGDSIGLENPGYPPVRNFAKAMQLVPVDLKIGDQGAEVPLPGQTPRLSILTPSNQSPLGGVMSPRRRQEFVAWAKRHKAWIIEDDYDSEFRYAGHPIPALAGFDHLDRTIYVGSFAKIFSNLLRIGYLIVPAELIGKFRVSLERFGFSASYMPQQALAEFIQTGAFYHHLRKVRRIYKERRKYLIGRLSADLAEFGWFTDHQAGMQIAFHLRTSFQDTVVSEKAEKLGVTAQPLSSFGTSDVSYNGLILGFCNYTEPEIDRAVATLRQVMLGQY